MEGRGKERGEEGSEGERRGAEGSGGERREWRGVEGRGESGVKGRGGEWMGEEGSGWERRNTQNRDISERKPFSEPYLENTTRQTVVESVAAFSLPCVTTCTFAAASPSIALPL